MKRAVFLSLLLALVLLLAGTVAALETVDFTPVRAPAKGPENAPVTIIEIADFM